MEGLNILVTGGNGFLGSWLSNELANKGATVFALFDKDNPGSVFDSRLSTAIKGDIRDMTFVKKTIEKNNINICVHLAAQTIVSEANKNPVVTLETNIRGTYNVLECARLLGIKVVVASSDKAYGYQKELPYTEETPLRGLHPYDASKSCADLIAQAYHNTYGVTVVITRLANIFGGGDMNMSRIVPSAAVSIARNEAPVIRTDGTPVRQYIYVEDAVRAYMKIIEKIDDVAGEAFNFGSSKPMTVYDIVKAMMNAANMKGEPIIRGESIKGEIHSQYLSSDKALKMLGWKPAFAMEDSLKKTIAWYRKYTGVGNE
ncbi:MAG: GDP-mannose 4,6-dehydratase [Candidatus Aenigmarchaeota archaeon]|nr:GDP-mannose 4,6-dehydratase [Candidatus Aenigmarchaeota archaeon]